MGFGILFVGYLLLFICKGVDIFPDVAAYALMLYAMSKLAEYNDGFKKAKIILTIALPIAAISDTVQIVVALTDWQSGYVGIIASVLMSIVIAAFHLFLFRGVRTLALEVELRKIADRATGCLSFTIVYFIAAIFMQLKFSVFDDLRRYFGITFFVIGLIWVAVNASLIFSCYMRICLEGDEDMPEDFSSGFGVRKKSENIDDETYSEIKSDVTKNKETASNTDKAVKSNKKKSKKR